MNEKNKDIAGELEIDLQRLMKSLIKKWWVIALSAVLCASIALGITRFFITPKYQSSAMFYVNNSAFNLSDASISLTSSDISASKSLVDSYIVILNARSTLTDVIDYADIDRTYTELKKMLSAASVNSTEIFEVVVTSDDPAEAEKIADAITYILPKRISSIIEGTSAKIVDTAIIASHPSSPSYLNNVVIGFALGLIAAVTVIVLKVVFDITLRTEEDVIQCSKYPLLASVPDINASVKGGYYYGSDQKKKKKHLPKGEAVIGGDLSFVAQEAYKLLRTKIQFSFSEDKNCYVIGVSSALAGEGKSLTSLNLAYTMAQLDKKILLIDGDMRKPSLHVKLHIEKIPGLSNYLTRQKSIDELIKKYTDKENGVEFDIITAGTNPPNPVELIGSAKMKEFIAELSNSYDYIIIDLTPVGEVSDALVASELTDGVLIVSRQNYGNRIAYTDTVGQFEFVNARILGTVINCAAETNGSYSGKYKKYRKYYSSYAKTENKE